MHVWSLLPLMFATQAAGLQATPAHADSATQSAPRPRMPFRIADSCPFEYGCAFGEWQACEALPVQRGPDAGIAFNIHAGERFRALRADMVVTRPGRVRLEYSYAPDASENPPLPAGSTVDVLDYLGEGHYRIWAAGRMLVVEAFWNAMPTPRRPGRKLRAPDMTWWVEIETASGAHGWLGLRNAVDRDGIEFRETLRMGDANTPDCAELLRQRAAD